MDDKNAGEGFLASAPHDNACDLELFAMLRIDSVRSLSTPIFKRGRKS
jgi:hypothetical protein